MNKITLCEFSGDGDLGKFKNAIAYLRENPHTVLEIPPKRYLLQDRNAYQLQQDVMEGLYGDNPYLTMFNYNFKYSTALDFTGVEDCIIQSNGAVFEADGFMQVIALQHCKNLQIKGITIDMTRRAYSKGTIINITEQYFDVLFEKQAYISANMPAPRMLIMNEACSLFDHCIHSSVISNAKKEEIAENTIRFFRSIGSKFINRELYVLHTWHSCPSILIYEAENITLTDVKIHSHPGMGVVAHRSGNLLFDRLMIVPAPGSSVSTNTDATHILSCYGEVRYENCIFEGQGDDSANIHSFYQTVKNIENNVYELEVILSSCPHSCKPDYLDTGDIVEYYSSDSLELLGTYTVTSSKADDTTHTCKITLDRPLPGGCIGNYLTAVSKLPKLRFINCRSKNHLARSVLVRTRDVIIEGCCFESSILAAIHISNEPYWGESSSAQNITIRNNRFIECGIIDKTSTEGVSGIKIYTGAHHPAKAVHKNICIEGNVIESSVPQDAIQVSYTDGLKIKNNTTTENVIIGQCINVKFDS